MGHAAGFVPQPKNWDIMKLYFLRSSVMVYSNVVASEPLWPSLYSQFVFSFCNSFTVFIFQNFFQFLRMTSPQSCVFWSYFFIGQISCSDSASGNSFLCSRRIVCLTISLIKVVKSLLWKCSSLRYNMAFATLHLKWCVFNSLRTCLIEMYRIVSRIASYPVYLSALELCK